MYDTCMPTWHIPVIYSIVSQKMAKSTKILAPKTSLPKSPYTETKLIGIRMAYRYEPESVETKMAGGPYMGEPAPNRG
mgnify:CR=1 FL=1